MLADQEEDDLFTPRTRKIVTIVVIALVVILLGVVLIPYIVWSVAGPMPSLG
jgi:type IV secretory pathway TrbL component